ncbi:MAG TPA: hypothetical protein VK901_08275 [Nitrospiraceae bacterium]|nr:hypothetical protein [Nitrospiraceae bacterium]
MTCPDLFQRPRPKRVLDTARFRYVRDGEVIRHWFERGWQGMHAPAEECFEPFIFTWIALNAWGECVTGQELDQHWVQDLAQDPNLNREFAACIADPESAVTLGAQEFRTYWPIPRVQVWRRVDHLRPESQKGHDRARFFRDNAIPCAPQCALRHFDATEDIPLDWLHFLPAVYRVRCNLFHGEKSPYDRVDVRIVRASLTSLAEFMNRVGWFS